MKRIVIDLSEYGCTTAAEELEYFTKGIKPKLDEICRKLAEIGIQEANSHLAEVAYGNAGNDDVTIDSVPVKTTNGYKVVMGGADVYFVEYGTGDQVSPHGDPVSVPIGWGTYSATHSHQLERYGFWYYGGEQFTGTHASRPLYFAGKAMRDAFPKVVKEVLKI